MPIDNNNPNTPPEEFPDLLHRIGGFLFGRQALQNAANVGSPAQPQQAPAQHGGGLQSFLQWFTPHPQTGVSDYEALKKIAQPPQDNIDFLRKAIQANTSIPQAARDELGGPSDKPATAVAVRILAAPSKDAKRKKDTAND